MKRPRIIIDKSTERAVHELLKSKAESKIYLFLLRKSGAKSEQIIKGTKLHPSTVRESLVKMHQQRLIYREKLKNDCIGKNPFFYKAVSPIQLVQRKAREMENRLNKLANLAKKQEGGDKYVKIRIYKREENA